MGLFDWNTSLTRGVRWLLTAAAVAIPLASAGVTTVAEAHHEPLITINDVAVTEPASGTVAAVFTVKLSKPSSDTITVNYTTKKGSARPGEDFQQKSGTITFAPGQTSKQISVLVFSDIQFEFDEQFFVELSAPQNAVILDGLGTGTIHNW